MLTASLDSVHVGFVISTVNIIGGFVVFQFMLNLFRRPVLKDFFVVHHTPGIAISALTVYDSEREEPVGKISCVHCVGAIGGLTSMHTAHSGCKVVSIWWTLLVSVGVGLMSVDGLIDLVVRARVDPTKMPHSVAAFRVCRWL